MRQLLRLVILVLPQIYVVTADAADDFVAGTQPQQRPAGAPVQTIAQRDLSPKQQLRGVSEPHPPSLSFIAEHGGWFTPMTVPGMTGRYDLRGFHERRHPEPDVIGGGRK